MIPTENELYDAVMRQLGNFWAGADESAIRSGIPYALQRTVDAISAKNYTNRLNTPEGVNFYIGNSEAWAVFIWNLSHFCSINKYTYEADCLYSLNKS